MAFLSMAGDYFSSLKLSALLRALPGGLAQGLIWGILALGVFMTFRMLGISDLTVDGSMATGAAVCIMLVLSGVNPQLALLASFFAGMIIGNIQVDATYTSINESIVQAIEVGEITF